VVKREVKNHREIQRKAVGAISSGSREKRRAPGRREAVIILGTKTVVPECQKDDDHERRNHGGKCKAG